MAEQPVWNPSDKDADIALSNGDRTFAFPSSPNTVAGTVRSTLGLSSGKWHVQLTLHGPGNTTSFRMGFATAAHSIALSLGDTDQSWAIGANANPRHDSTWATDLGDSYADGDAVDLFVDLDAGRIWYGIAGAPWSGDPAAGTGEHYSLTPGTALFLAGSRNSNANTTRSATLRLLADYAGTSPAGFTRGWGSSAVPVELTAEAAALEATGHPATLAAGTGAVLTAAPARIAVHAHPVTATIAGGVDLVAGVGRMVAAGAAAALAAGHLLTAAAAGIVVATPPAQLVAGTGAVLTAAPARIELRSGTPSLAAGSWALLTADPAVVAVTAPPAALITGQALQAAPAALATQGHAASLDLELGFDGQAAPSGLAVRSRPATIVAGAALRRPVPPPGDLDALLAPAAGAIEWALVIDAWDAEAGAVVPLRWSAGDYTTRPGDSLPSTRLPGRLADLQLRRALWAGTELFGRSEPARGVAVVENADGALDPLATAATGSGARRWHFRWRRAQVLVGHPAWGWDDFRPVFTGLVEDVTFDGGRASFQLRDRLRRLDRPVQQQVFGGDRVLLASASSVTVGAGSRSFILPDLATNGTFAASLSGWFAGSGWTHASGAAAKAAGSASALEQDVATAAGQAYRLRAVVTRSAGTLQVTLDGEPLGEPVAASATLRPTFVAAGSTSRIGFLADAAFVGTVDGVTLRQEPDAVADDPVRIARTGDLAGTWMAGRVTSWTEALGELVVDVTEAAGAGTHADWSIWLRPYAGPAELAAKNLPVALGSVRHVAPPALDSVQGLWLYRLADAPVRVDPAAGHGVFDGGVALDRAESFPPGPGEAFVDGAEGALWVASRPQYPLTVTMEAGLGAAAGERVFAVPGLYTFQVPPGITALRARLWGAGGGHGGAGATGFPVGRRLRRRRAGGRPGRGAAGGGAGRWRGRRG
ncbi:hypothetical protein STVA_40390 [Allostella vacuolata]|nr:hypothetical protein STVA_40390 [Stella vacuolata]